MKWQVLQGGDYDNIVAPLAGAWIEIMLKDPKRETIDVAPLAGAWIEITLGGVKVGKGLSRSTRGSVD